VLTTAISLFQTTVCRSTLRRTHYAVRSAVTAASELLVYVTTKYGMSLYSCSSLSTNNTSTVTNRCKSRSLHVCS